VIKLDIKKYSELKADGKVTISKIGDDYVASQKRYSAESGIETLPVNTKLDIEDLRSRQAYLQAEIDAIDIVIANCQALD
jgi:hypothetical protein